MEKKDFGGKTKYNISGTTEGSLRDKGDVTDVQPICGSG
jgi:hypothetical protein